MDGGRRDLKKPTEIGAFEAKNTLSELLRRAEKGETFVITNRGQPVAKLGPVEEAPKTDRGAAIERLKALGDKHPLNAGPGGIAALRAEGRR